MPQLQTITFNIGDKSQQPKTNECHQQQSSFNSVVAATLGTSLLFNINIGKYGGKKLVAVWKCNSQIIPHRRSFYEYRSTRTTIGFLIVNVKTEDIGSWTAELYDLNTLESRSRLPYEFAVQVSRAQSGRSNDQRKLNATATTPTTVPVKEAINRNTRITTQRGAKTVIPSVINSAGRKTPVIKEHLKLEKDVRSRPRTINSAPNPTNTVGSRRVLPSSKLTGSTAQAGQGNHVNIRQCRQESFVRLNVTRTNRHNVSAAQPSSRKIGANSQEESYIKRNVTQVPAIITNRSTGYKQSPDCHRPIKVSNAANLNRNQSTKIASPAAEKEQRQLATTTKTSLYPRLAREPSSAVLMVTRRANAVNNVVNKARHDALSSPDHVKSNGRLVNKRQSSGCVPAVILASTTTVLDNFNSKKQTHLQQVPTVQVDSVSKMQRAEVNKSEVGAKAKTPDPPTSVNGGSGIKVKPTGSGKISDLINKFNRGHDASSTATSSPTELEKPKPDRRPVGRLTIPKFAKEEKLQDSKPMQDYKPKVKLITSPVPPVRNSGDHVPNEEQESSQISTPAKVIKEYHAPEADNVPFVPDQTQFNPDEITKDFEPSTLSSDSSVLESNELDKDQGSAVATVKEVEQATDNPEEIQSALINVDMIESGNGLQECPEESRIATLEETEVYLADEPATVDESADTGKLIQPEEAFDECMKQPIVDLNGNETSKIIEEPIAAAPEPEAIIAATAITPEHTTPFSPKEPSKVANGIQERIHIVAKIGERVELTTLSDADDSAEIAPNQEIEWRLPNKQVTAGERNLVLENVSFAHSGKYEAVISKRRGSVLRKTFSLNVEGPPDAITSLSVCKLQNPPAVEVSWKGCAFDGGSGILHYIVQYNGEEFQTSDVSIKIPLCDVEEATTSHTFQVTAANKHGRGPWSTIDYCECIEIEDADKFHDYTKLEELGKGRFGTVSRVEYFGHCYAGKFIKAIRAADREKAKLEVQILSRLRGHERLVNIVAAFQLQREVVILTELLTGGELFERIVADDFHLTEAKCKEFVQEILAGIDYVHSKSIIHLDIKPENILITPTGLKLIDFGLSQIYDPNQKQCVLFGTPEFVSPEIINYEPIGFYCDIWSIGVVTYVLVSGLSPFMGDSDSETFANVTLGEFDFDDEAFEQVSQECLDFIRACLTRSPVNRPSTQECINHPWMLQNSDTTIRKDKLKSFVLRRKWQKTGNAIRAIGRLRSYGSFNNDALNSS